MADPIDFLDRERKFNKDIQDLKSSPVEMVDDFQRAVSKDLPVEKINRIGDILPQKTEAEFLSDQIARQAKSDAKRAALGKVSNEVLDYNQLRKEFADKAKKAARTGGKKVLGAAGMIPGIGTGLSALAGLASAAMSGDASATIPTLDSAEPTGPLAGSFDDRVTKGQLTDEDKQQLMAEQARIRALQGM